MIDVTMHCYIFILKFSFFFYFRRLCQLDNNVVVVIGHIFKPCYYQNNQPFAAVMRLTRPEKSLAQPMAENVQKKSRLK